MIGSIISHYKILEKLGEGGMGVVYKAQDTKLDRIVALKFLPHHVVASEAEQARFLQEAKSAAVLNHPNVCVIHSIEEADDKQFIVMEYVDGSTLRALVEQHRDNPLKINDAVTYAIHIGDALQEAHSKGIVHRDIKSENIMVNAKQQIKVMDFGLAKLKGSLKLTRSSSTVGTLAYMAPEQLQGGTIDARSDIFSFGAVLFEMLTGKLPFRGEHEAAMMYSIVNEECDSVLKYRLDAPAELDRILRRALEKDPNERYQHADDMTSELKKMLKQSSRVSHVSPTPTSSGASSLPPVKEPQQKKPALIYGGIALVLLAGIAGYFLLKPAQSQIDSLAVLPFVNVGKDPNVEYLSDGMTESIINSLTRIPNLRVIPRSTMFRFKGKDIDPQEVGSQLNVNAVLTGRVVQRNGDLNLQLDLIDVNRQSQIYGNQYQRGSSDIILIQEDVVRDVMQQLGVTISSADEKAVTKRYTDNVEAYKYYLQGRFHWQKRKASEILTAIDYFNRALAIDPSYPLAYVGLADCYIIQSQYAGTPSRETSPKAISAAQKALALDHSLAEAHTAMAFAHASLWEWTEAEKEFKISLTLNPQYPTTYHWYSILLFALGRGQEATSAIRRAHELDPLSPVIALNVALASYQNGAYEKGIEQTNEVIALDSSFSPAYSRKAQMLAKMGRLEEAYSAALKAVRISDSSAEALSFLGYSAARLGKRDEALNIVNELEGRYTLKTSGGYYIARVYLGLGDTQSVFKWLNVDFGERSSSMIWLRQDLEWGEYRSDPRLVELLRKVGLTK